MKTLMKLANSTKVAGIGGYIAFEGKAARATDCEMHAVIASGEWDFDCATVVSLQQIKSAMALSKKPVWAGNTLNGIKLTNVGDANDWPALPDFKGARIECAELPAKLAHVLPAMANQDIRYYLNGLCFDHTERAIIGCDGHRLHIVKDAYTSTLTGQAIVPDVAFKLIGAKNIIHMDFTDTHCRIGYIGGYLITRLIEGKFPDYHRVLPSDTARPNVVPFNVAQIAAAKSIVAVNKANKTKYSLAAISTTGTLSACDITVPCFDHWTMTPPAMLKEGQSAPTLYGINAEYLLDAMQCADHGTIAVDTANDSILVANGNFRAVVMPCRI